MEIIQTKYKLALPLLVLAICAVTIAGTYTFYLNPALPATGTSYDFTITGAQFNDQAWSPNSGTLVFNNHTAGPTWNVICVVTHPDGTSQTYNTSNLVTDSGIQALMAQWFNAVNSSRLCKYIAFSTSTDPPDAAWTAVPDEVTGHGLDKAAGTPTYNSNANYSVAKVFSVTGTQTNIYMTALCFTSGASAPDDLYAIAVLTPGPLNVGAGDTVTITWINTGSGT